MNCKKKQHGDQIHRLFCMQHGKNLMSVLKTHVTFFFVFKKFFRNQIKKNLFSYTMLQYERQCNYKRLLFKQKL